MYVISTVHTIHDHVYVISTVHTVIEGNFQMMRCMYIRTYIVSGYSSEETVHGTVQGHNFKIWQQLSQPKPHTPVFKATCVG